MGEPFFGSRSLTRCFFFLSEGMRVLGEWEQCIKNLLLQLPRALNCACFQTKIPKMIPENHSKNVKLCNGEHLSGDFGLPFLSVLNCHFLQVSSPLSFPSHPLELWRDPSRSWNLKQKNFCVQGGEGDCGKKNSCLNMKAGDFFKSMIHVYVFSRKRVFAEVKSLGGN